VRQVTQLKEELADLQTASHRTRRDRQEATGTRVLVLDGVSQEALQRERTRTSLDQDQENRGSAQTEEMVLELNSKTCTEASPQRPCRDLDLSGQQVLQLQRDLQDSRDRLQEAQQDYEEEKRKMRQQLVELEDLVLVLEEVMDPAGPPRFVEHDSGPGPKTTNSPDRLTASSTRRTTRTRTNSSSHEHHDPAAGPLPLLLLFLSS